MYLTTYKKQTSQKTQISLNYNEIMQSNLDFNEINTTENNLPEYYKITFNIKNPKKLEELSDNQRQHIYRTAMDIQSAYSTLMPFFNNYTEQYYEFKIPKRTGGLRTINAPKTAFKEALSKVKDIFENKIKCLPHNAAYAYVKTRSTLDAVQQHKNNKSNWYLKLDLQDFFPNCTPELIYNNLIQLYPFYYFDQLPTDARIPDKLKKIIEVCCLNGGLPQGTPMSPLLTNLLMVPYDYTIYKTLTRGLGEHFVYTRYADDIIISSKSEFDWRHIQQLIQSCLGPFQIKDQKTRYGSKAGSNWNLGLMTNKDNNITLGYQKKKLLNAMLNNFLQDCSNNLRWELEDVYALQGQMSYLKHIEPNYYQYILDKYETKYNFEYKWAIKAHINHYPFY